MLCFRGTKGFELMPVEARQCEENSRNRMSLALFEAPLAGLFERMRAAFVV
jgi:hypothetical protein